MLLLGTRALSICAHVLYRGSRYASHPMSLQFQRLCGEPLRSLYSHFGGIERHIFHIPRRIHPIMLVAMFWDNALGTKELLVLLHLSPIRKLRTQYRSVLTNIKNSARKTILMISRLFYTVPELCESLLPSVKEDTGSISLGVGGFAEAHQGKLTYAMRSAISSHRGDHILEVEWYYGEQCCTVGSGPCRWRVDEGCESVASEYIDSEYCRDGVHGRPQLRDRGADVSVYCETVD
ncbi:hypothetical protein Tco_1285630 [Tanacetum coccineum]